MYNIRDWWIGRLVKRAVKKYDKKKGTETSKLAYTDTTRLRYKCMEAVCSSSFLSVKYLRSLDIKHMHFSNEHSYIVVYHKQHRVCLVRVADGIEGCEYVDFFIEED